MKPLDTCGFRDFILYFKVVRLMEYVLRTKLLNELNILKKTLKEDEKNGEISREEYVKITSEIGKIKSILYNDVAFKNLFKALV